MSQEELGHYRFISVIKVLYKGVLSWIRATFDVSLTKQILSKAPEEISLDFVIPSLPSELISVSNISSFSFFHTLTPERKWIFIYNENGYGEYVKETTTSPGQTMTGQVFNQRLWKSHTA